jgi:prophage regulatory protein
MSTANHREPHCTSTNERTGPRPRPNRDTRPRAAASAGVLDDPLIDIKVVCQMTGFSSSTPIYDRLREGDFPQPIRLSARCTRWRASAVKTWIASKEGKAQ